MGEEKIIIKVVGKSGKVISKDLFDINIKEHVERGPYDTFYAFISRWYRLPESYKSEYEALSAIMEFRKKYEV